MRKRPFLVFLVLTLVLSAVAAGCGGGDDEGEAAKGTGTVTVLSLWGGSERDAFQKVLAAFTQKTGIKTKYETARDFTTIINTRLAAGNPPMMAIVPRPGIVADLARDGELITLDDLGLDSEAVNENYSKAWTDLTTIDGDVYGIVAKANSKSTIWYRPQTLSDMNAQPPGTWQELLDLTDKIKSSGKTPWAVGAGDGWPLTDWFESIYLYQAGPDKYEQLFNGDIPFTDPSVKAALNEMLKILNDDNLPGGVEGALGTKFVDDIGQVFGKNPKAELYYEGGFVGGIATGQVNPSLKPGTDIDFFPFPTINEEFGQPLLGAGDVAVAFENNEDVKALMEYLASGEAGTTWVSTGAIVSPNKAVELSAYPNELVKKEAEQVRDAETFKFDGSDLLPGALGTEWPTVLQGIIKTPDKMDQLLGDFQKKAEPEFANAQ
jgi:ABC-type glycerol-3-phosphate transport system substrate-binding protein